MRVPGARCAALGKVAAAADPGEAVLTATLAVRRAVISELVTITVNPHTGGRTFNPESVEILPR